MDYGKLLDELADAAREAGDAILEIVRRGFEVEAKHDSSPVTEADRAAELIILAALARAAPGVPVVAEEEVAAGRIPAHDDTYFLVDPLDGTKEFVRGGDDYTVNIGLIDSGTPKTPFMKFGDHIKIEMNDAHGHSIFGSIEQTVHEYKYKA